MSYLAKKQPCPSKDAIRWRPIGIVATAMVPDSAAKDAMVREEISEMVAIEAAEAVIDAMEKASEVVEKASEVVVIEVVIEAAIEAAINAMEMAPEAAMVDARSLIPVL